MNGTGDINSSMAFGSTSGFIGVRFSSSLQLILIFLFICILFVFSLDCLPLYEYLCWIDYSTFVLTDKDGSFI
jgi:hypothetical protein